MAGPQMFQIGFSSEQNEKKKSHFLHKPLVLFFKLVFIAGSLRIEYHSVFTFFFLFTVFFTFYSSILLQVLSGRA